MESDSSERVEIPANFEDAPVDDLVQLIADMLDRLMSHNDLIPLSPESLTRFHSRSTPSISILDYLKRIIRFTNVEKSCLLISLFNIDQICSRMPLFTLSSLTCHRFVITSITVSSKGLCDAFCPNNLYAKVGGISVTELNVLEREFLAMIDWRLMCTRDILQEYYVNLVRTHSAGKFVLAGTHTPSNSSESDTEMENNSNSGQSAPSSPTAGARRRHLRLSISESSAILMDHGPPLPLLVPEVIHPHPQSHRPTIEQNMAFAALQQSQQDINMNIDITTTATNTPRSFK
ncbi:cyclin-domain-containing protein [Phlegmacium glaucopus]|nr:cyclin-domain-containing protein [Phlegmacium glaucopus]